ncbi:CAP domain-containing protein [Pirellulales bacterium]|nr:CAP domain-containing protein [Pirellulales bacterium]
MARSASLLVGLLFSLFPGISHAQTLWTENAENGTIYINDFTDAGYELIQSDVFAEGSFAFHLANPGGDDNWFEITQAISPQSDTKLFFQSRLRTATSSQLARVQLSTDGGTTWPEVIYSQPGGGQPGEGNFGLREVDLSSYASQIVNFRFFYEFTSGSFFPQTSPQVGWFVDDIQIASEFTKSQYSIGNPSSSAQLYLEMINRARVDAIGEATRLANETDSDVLQSYSNWGIDGQDIIDQFGWYINNSCIDLNAQPLAFNENLNQAAELHTQDMFDNQFQGHVTSSNPPPPFEPGDTLTARMAAVGYSWTNLGENVFANADSVEHGHAGFDVDWGDTVNSGDSCYNPAYTGEGMQNPAGHRRSIHNDAFSEIGVGVINGTNGSVGPQLVTQDFGSAGDSAFVTGVVFEDLDGDMFYDEGEGRSGVRIDVDGSAFYAISSDSGGYAIPVGDDGSYMVTFSSGQYADMSTVANVAGGKNVKIDLLAVASNPVDFNGDGVIDGLDVSKWQADYGLNAGSDADADNDSDGRDYLALQKVINQESRVTAVPEPASGLAFTLLLAAASVRRSRSTRQPCRE